MIFVLTNKGKGTFNTNNPISEEDLVELGGKEELSWTNISGKPSVYPPEPHSHNYENPLNFVGSGATSVSRNGNTITISSTDNAGGDGADGNNYPTSISFNTSNGIFTINRNDTSALTEDFDGRYALISHSHSWSSITSKPSTFPPSSHTHNYDNFGSWNLGANASYTAIGSGESVNFVGSGATSVSRSGNTITISSTDNAGGDGADGNNYPTSMSFSTSSGVLTINRNGLSAISEDLDGRYAYTSHDHDDRYVPKTGGTFTGNIIAPKFYQSSLRSLKKNIEPYRIKALDLIGRLEIVEFDYKEGEGNNIGIIADDTAPEFLSNEGDAVNLYNTIFIQAKAIQELKGKAESQEERITRLENLVEKLTK